MCTPLFHFIFPQRHNVVDLIPQSIRKHLEKQVSQQKLVKHEHESWQGLQNLVVGNNSIACNAAAFKASELGYRPVVITKSLEGEAVSTGKLYTKLAKFIMMCFDRKLSENISSSLAMLEVELVAGGIPKKTVNLITDEVDIANNQNSDICIIASGHTTVSLQGSGVGGKNLEVATGAVMQLRQDFRGEKLNNIETGMCLLSADTDGFDGIAPAAGAMVDLDFVDQLNKSGVVPEKYIDNNDTYTMFYKVSQENNLVYTNHTGTNVMDMIILLVRRPRMKKYKWV